MKGDPVPLLQDENYSVTVHIKKAFSLHRDMTATYSSSTVGGDTQVLDGKCTAWEL